MRGGTGCGLLVEDTSCRCGEGGGRGQMPGWVPPAGLGWLHLPPKSTTPTEAHWARLGSVLVLATKRQDVGFACPGPGPGPSTSPILDAHPLMQALCLLCAVATFFFIRMQKPLPGNLERKNSWIAVRKHSRQMLAPPSTWPPGDRVLGDPGGLDGLRQCLRPRQRGPGREGTESAGLK